MLTWRREGSSAVLCALDEGWSARIAWEERHGVLLEAAGKPLLTLAGGDLYPSAPLAVHCAGQWLSLGPANEATVEDEQVVASWEDPAVQVVVHADPETGVQFVVRAPGADAVTLALAAGPEEHFYGLGERFNKLDQRGELVELWVKNGASGDDSYKPIPFVASSAGYGLVIDTTRRIFAALAHPMMPEVASFTVQGEELKVWLIPGPTSVEVVRRYSALIGRPSIPPSWFFRPWKSRDARDENQQTVLKDIARHCEHDIPGGVKLIDSGWQTGKHSFTFDPAKYPDVPGMIQSLREAGMELVLWISPWMTVGIPEYDECARRGFLISDESGAPYLHRISNTPGALGSIIDFSNPQAVAWWQERIRGLFELGVRGFKTDFGEQVPEDACFANGKTGAEMHNLLPVLYQGATWEVAKEFQSALLARSAWTGSQCFSGIWAGDQSADFSPWAGLPTAIVAGQSAGWSGFPYWGSDVGGYFNPPDDEVFARWAQFGAVSPVMEVHGRGEHDPWELAPQTLAIYRSAAQLHDRLVPYTLAAAREARETGLPIMRAMALLYPGHEEAHRDWVQYQYLYGPYLLAAPVYGWVEHRQIWFPPGVWIDIETGERYTGPTIKKVSAPLVKLPLYARAGAVIPLRHNPETDDLTLRLYTGEGSEATLLRLLDGTTIAFDLSDDAGGRLEVSGEVKRRYRLELPFAADVPLRTRSGNVRIIGDEAAWAGPAVISIGLAR